MSAMYVSDMVEIQHLNRCHIFVRYYFATKPVECVADAAADSDVEFLLK